MLIIFTYMLVNCVYLKSKCLKPNSPLPETWMKKLCLETGGEISL